MRRHNECERSHGNVMRISQYIFKDDIDMGTQVFNPVIGSGRWLQSKREVC
ncbi:hypothetical protein ABIE18_001297 [Arthrobacter sp. 2762]